MLSRIQGSLCLNHQQLKRQLTSNPCLRRICCGSQPAPSGIPTGAQGHAATPRGKAVAETAQIAPSATCASGVGRKSPRQSRRPTRLVVGSASRQARGAIHTGVAPHADTCEGRGAAGMEPAARIATCACGSGRSTKSRLRRAKAKLQSQARNPRASSGILGRRSKSSSKSCCTSKLLDDDWGTTWQASRANLLLWSKTPFWLCADEYSNFSSARLV